MAIRTLTYIYHDPTDTLPHWKGETIVFDDTITSLAEKVAEQRNLRTVGLKETYFKFPSIDGVFLDNQNKKK